MLEQTTCTSHTTHRTRNKRPIKQQSSPFPLFSNITSKQHLPRRADISRGHCHMAGFYLNLAPKNASIVRLLWYFSTHTKEGTNRTTFPRRTQPTGSARRGTEKKEREEPGAMAGWQLWWAHLDVLLHHRAGIRTLGIATGDRGWRREEFWPDRD
jgi:hypothetical protein